LNIQDLADKAAATSGLSKADARLVVQGVFDAIATDVAAGNEVAIAGFGKFARKDTPARDGRNPATGETIKIAAGRKAVFSAAKGLKDRVAG
jgi:DNA-binding protein HU-beta